MKNYLNETPLLDFSNPFILQLVKSKKWQQLNEVEKVKAVYNFVRDEIKFGYNTADSIPASQVLDDGYGQCNTKATLLMAMLRAIGIPNRIHGFTINKALQKGAISGIWYFLSPANILHSWVEVFVNGNWYNLEGVILDKTYLSKLQSKFADCKTTFCGFGVYTDNFQNPSVDWNENDTYIQKLGINRDFGLFDSPDDFYEKHSQELSPIKKWLFKNLVRHCMNRNITAIRNYE